MKIVTALKDSGLLLKGVSETIQNEVKEQKGEFLVGGEGVKMSFTMVGQ